MSRRTQRPLLSSTLGSNLESGSLLLLLLLEQKLILQENLRCEKRWKWKTSRGYVSNMHHAEWPQWVRSPLSLPASKASSCHLHSQVFIHSLWHTDKDNKGSVGKTNGEQTIICDVILINFGWFFQTILFLMTPTFTSGHFLFLALTHNNNRKESTETKKKG